MNRTWKDVKAGDIVIWRGREMRVYSKGTHAFCLEPVRGGHGNMVRRDHFEATFPQSSY